MNTTTIHFGRGKSVTVSARTRYLGTPTGSVEREEVTWRGYVMDGCWDGDARHNTEVRDVPAEALPLLNAIWQARAYRRELAHIEEMAEFYASDMGRPHVDPPTPAQITLLRDTGYDRNGRDLTPEVPTAGARRPVGDR